MDGLRELFNSLQARANQSPKDNTPTSLSDPFGTPLIKGVPVGWPEMNWDDFLWAYLCVSSRALIVSFDGQEETCLVPFLSYCNHSPDAAMSSPQWEKDKLVVTTSRNVAQGEEIFLRYHPSLSNGQLLLFYGFTLPNNQHEVVPLSLEPPDMEEDGDLDGVVKRMLLLKLGEDHGLKLEWELQRGQFPPGLLATLRLLFAPRDLLDSLDIQTLQRLYDEQSPELESVIKSALRSSLELLINTFSIADGGLKDIQKLIEELPLPSQRSARDYHRFSALMYRQGLLTLLDDLITTLPNADPMNIEHEMVGETDGQ